MSNNNFHALSPSQFENLAYDLLTWRGMRNAAWRTPGADGGRDIEGEYEIRDLSGTHQRQKWYVDCKRYGKSVDWPTVYEKLSYAVSNSADYLLIVCTPSVSPQCRTEIDRWNATQTKPKIRTWEQHYLDQLLIEHPEIAIKHGFRKATLLDAPGFVNIAIEASKIADAAYCRSVFETGLNMPELELASALATFLAVQMQQPRSKISMTSVRGFDPLDDSYDWIKWTPTQVNGRLTLETSAVRAVLCIIRLSAGGAQSINVEASNTHLKISLENNAPLTVKDATISLLKQICLFGSLELDFQTNSLTIKGQQ